MVSRVESHLMPGADLSPPCSEFTKAMGIRAAGTGLTLDRIILVSVPEPWPKPALKHDWLRPAAALVGGASAPTRLFAAEPWDSQMCVELYERVGSGFTATRFPFDDHSEIALIVADIVESQPGAPKTELINPTFLVCVQGSHDLCCGRHGQRFASQIASQRPEWQIRRVSHTGGHKFAPTFVALPSGRMWAYGDLALADRITAGTENADDLTMRCRGWLGATKGPHQVAEIAARIAAGPAGRAGPAIVEPPRIGLVESVADPTNNERVRYSVAVGDDTAIIEVRRARIVPTIACESPGGLPAKQATEYEWTVLEDPWN